MQCLQRTLDLRMIFEVFQRLLDVHFQYVVDVLSLEPDLQCFFVKAMPLTDRTGNPDVRQKIHLQLVGTVPLAGFAAAPFDVERESPRLEASQL